VKVFDATVTHSAIGEITQFQWIIIIINWQWTMTPCFRQKIGTEQHFPPRGSHS